MSYGSGEGSGPADPPFAQLSGASGGVGDYMQRFGSGAFNSLAPSYMRRAAQGAGDMAAFQKRRDANKRIQGNSMTERGKVSTRDKARELLNEYGAQ